MDLCTSILQATANAHPSIPVPVLVPPPVVPVIVPVAIPADAAAGHPMPLMPKFAMFVKPARAAIAVADDKSGFSPVALQAEIEDYFKVGTCLSDDHNILEWWYRVGRIKYPLMYRVFRVVAGIVAFNLFHFSVKTFFKV